MTSDASSTDVTEGGEVSRLSTQANLDGEQSMYGLDSGAVVVHH